MANESRLRIVIDALNLAESELKNLQGDLAGVEKKTQDSKFSWTEFNSALQVGKQTIAALQQVYGQTVQPTLDLASAQRELAAAGQISVEEAGRLIQVGDDLKISSDTLKRSFKEMVKDGIQPTFANLKAIADKYQSIQDPTQRLQYAQQALGRSYADMLPFLEKTGAELDALAKSDEAAGLVMSTEAVQAARDYEIALDGLGDSIQGIKVNIGTALIPALTEEADWLNHLIEISGKRMTAAEVQADREAWLAARTEDVASASRNAMTATGDLATAAANSVTPMSGLGGSFKDVIDKTDILKFSMGELTSATLFNLILSGLEPGSQAAIDMAFGMGLMNQASYDAATSVKVLTAKYDLNHDGVISDTEATADYREELIRLAQEVKVLPDLKIITVKVRVVGSGSIEEQVNTVVGSGGGSGGHNGYGSYAGHQVGDVPGVADGGVLAGSKAGYPAMLHGIEAVVPLPDGRSIPVEMRGGGGGAGEIRISIQIPVVLDGRQVGRASVEGTLEELAARGYAVPLA